jgi:hypothetical protein
MISRRTREKYWPYAVGVTAALLYFFVFCHWKPHKPNELIQSGLTIGAISVGFLANMKAILFSIEKKKVVEDLKVGGYFKYLIDYLMEAINLSFCLALLGAIGFVVDFEDRDRLRVKLLLTLWVFILSSAVAAYYRIINLFARILRAD